MQAGLILAIFAACRCAFAGPDRYAQQLRRECDALLQSAIHRPYGLAWEDGNSTGNATVRTVTLQPPGTPAAGILLWWSGKFLDEPNFQQAALQTARGIDAVQNSSGQIPRRAIFGASAHGRDEPRAVPDRAATCAALALAITLIDEHQPSSEIPGRIAQRASHWLLKQQNDDGGWAAAYPADATLGKAARLIRLDDANYRDATFAMLLASDASGDSLLAKSAEKSIAKLLSLRPAIQQATTQPVRQQLTLLWSTAYRPSGAIDPSLKDFPAGADVVASRVALQTLLGAYLIDGDKSAGDALDSTAQALLDLQNGDGTWQRIDLASAPATQPTTQNVFNTPSTNPAAALGRFALQPTLDAVQKLKAAGREKYLAAQTDEFTIRQRLAATLCGLCESPFDKNPADFETLQTPPPEDLPGRLRRIWLLLIRAKLESTQS
jgi:hypothetical protein